MMFAFLSLSLSLCLARRRSMCNLLAYCLRLTTDGVACLTVCAYIPQLQYVCVWVYVCMCSELPFFQEVQLVGIHINYLKTRMTTMGLVALNTVGESGFYPVDFEKCFAKIKNGFYTVS